MISDFKMVYVTSTSLKGYIYSSIHEFILINYFDIKCWFYPVPKIIQLNWCFSNYNWIKRNIDEISSENIGISTCDDIFRNNLETFLGVFSGKIEVCTSFQD